MMSFSLEFTFLTMYSSIYKFISIKPGTGGRGYLDLKIGRRGGGRSKTDNREGRDVRS